MRKTVLGKVYRAKNSKEIRFKYGLSLSNIAIENDKLSNYEQLECTKKFLTAKIKHKKDDQANSKESRMTLKEIEEKNDLNL